VLTGLGRNELLRFSDRIESVATILAALLMVVAIPVAAAFGTVVRDETATAVAAYAASLHQTEAIVERDGTPAVSLLSRGEFSTPLRWNAGGHVHSTTVAWPALVHAGDHVALWVDASGERRAAPAEDRASQDAITLAIMLWMAVAALSAGALGLLRWRLNVGRLARWDRELETLADESWH
jgi:hypothetical protein